MTCLRNIHTARVRLPRLRADPRPPASERFLPPGDELVDVEGPRRVRGRGEVLGDQERIVPVVRLLARALCRAVAVAVVEVPRAPADAVRLAVGLFSRSVVAVDRAVILFYLCGVVFVVRRQRQRVGHERAHQRAAHTALARRRVRGRRRGATRDEQQRRGETARRSPQGDHHAVWFCVRATRVVRTSVLVQCCAGVLKTAHLLLLLFFFSPGCSSVSKRKALAARARR